MVPILFLTLIGAIMGMTDRKPDRSSHAPVDNVYKSRNIGNHVLVPYVEV